MLLQALTLTHHITTMLFGIFLSAFFLGVKQERKNVLLLLSVGLICLLLYIPCTLLLGETYTDPIYPLLVHLPLLLVLVFHYKFRWLPQQLDRYPVSVPVRFGSALLPEPDSDDAKRILLPEPEPLSDHGASFFQVQPGVVYSGRYAAGLLPFRLRHNEIFHTAVFRQ